ncbi:hypothetical protein AgCh_028537 [Apium graveolens]
MEVPVIPFSWHGLEFGHNSKGFTNKFTLSSVGDERLIFAYGVYLTSESFSDSRLPSIAVFPICFRTYSTVP